MNSQFCQFSDAVSVSSAIRLLHQIWETLSLQLTVKFS